MLRLVWLLFCLILLVQGGKKMNYNDYELVYYAQENDELASKILYDKYYVVLYNKALQAYKILKSKGLELSDVLLEIRFIFEKAIMDFDQNGTSSFSTFVNVCLDRQIVSLIARYSRNKYIALNDALSFEDLTDNVDFVNVVSPEAVLFDEYNGLSLYNRIKSKLTFLESNVFELKLFGLSYSEIADFLEVDNKEIYNAISRIKFKFKLVK